MTSAIAEDVEALEERADLAIRGGVADTTMIRTWLGRAKAAKGDLDGAVVVLEEGLPGSASQAGFLTSFAGILLTRAAREDASNRMRDAQRALELSIAARDIRRLWGGDSAEPTVLACQAAFMLEDFDGIIRLASVHDGEATEEEAADPEVRQLLALTRLIKGGDAPDPAGEFEQAWFRGLALARNPSTRDEAVAELELAAAIAVDERELDRAQRSLANLGQVEIPRLDEVRQRDSDHADVLLAIAEKNAGRADLATTRLRPLVGRNRLAAMQMADLYADAGDVTASAELLREAGQRFSDPRLLLGGARYFLNASNLEESSRCISFALALVPTMSPLRREARWLAVEVAAKSGDAASVEAAASTALAEGELSPSMRWVRVEALTNIHRLKDAWAEVRTAPVLTPDTDERARLFLQLLMRREPARLDLMVEVMDRFRESHDVLATGLSLFFAFDATDPRDQTAVAAMQAHASQFVSTYPESPVMRSMEVTVDDPEKLREQMRQMLQPDVEKDRQVRALSERAASGQLPIGFAASVLGRTYLDTILGGSSISFTSVPRDAATLEEEVLAATAHLDKAIVVDASSLVSMSFLPELWRAVLVAFSSVSIAGASFAEIDDSVFRKPASGSLRWDHEQDTWTMVSIPEDQIESLRTQRDLIRSWATELRVLRTGSLADLPELADAAGESTWLAALATAREQGCALLSDDVALAALARSLDVPAFGSFAVALSLARSGRLEVADLDKFVVALFQAQADDLPLTPAQLAALSRSLGWPLGPSLHPMTRPHYWRDVQAAHAAYVTTIDGLGATAESTGNALYCASLGVIRGVAVGSPERLIAGLFVSALLRTEADPTIVESLVAATRAACRAYELADPFDACVSALIDVVGSSEDPRFTAQFVTAAFSGLQPEDRSRVTAIILDVSRR